MKFKRFSVLVLTLLAVFSEPSIRAQKTRTRQLERIKNPGEVVKQSYERREVDGLKVTIYQVESNGMRPVHPGQSFTNGDRIKVRFESNFDGYIYVINLTPGGETRLLFPWPSSRRNNVRAGQVYDIPATAEFRFNEEPGLEVLQIVMSRSQVYFLEEILDDSPLKARNILLDKDAEKKLRNLAGKPRRLKGSGIATQTESKRTEGLQTRILTLESRKEGSIVVLAVGKGLTRFRPGELSIFEIRLNHY